MMELFSDFFDVFVFFQVYSTFGFGVSLLQVLGFNNMLQYSEFILSNLEFPRPLPTIQDDMFQVGIPQ